MKEEKTIDQKYDEISKAVLENRLGRPAKPNEIINSDNDADLVNETLWQLVKELDQRVKALESKNGAISSVDTLNG